MVVNREYSNKNKAPEKAKKQPVVKTPVKKVKKGLVERAVLALIGPEGIPAVSRYVTKEVVAPAVKNIIADSVTSGINRMLFPDGGRSSNGRTGYNKPYGQRTNYSQRTARSDYNEQSFAPADGRERQRRFESTDYMLEDRNEALSVIDNLVETLNDFQQVSVADFYELIDVPTEFTDNNWGWHDLGEASVRPYHEGWVIVLPKPRKL